MKTKQLIALLAAPVLGLGCGANTDAPGRGLDVQVAPLELLGIGNAVYTIVVQNGDTPPQTVWTKTVDSDQYGDGRGSLSYIGTCDATKNPHTVTLTLDELYDTDNALLDSPTDYKNPGPITLTDIVCRENGDVPVVFNLTLLRAAEQGFFDIAVNFKDVFCSAKVDCQEELLHNAEGDRDATVVMAFACTSGGDGDGAAEPTWLYLSAVTLTCTDPTGTLPPITQSIMPGSATTPGQQGATPPLLFDWALYNGVEDFPGIDKCFWNYAFGLDLATIGPRTCTLTATGTASDVRLTGGAIAANQTWPVVQFDVDVVGPNQALCDNNGLDAQGSGVVTTYITPNTDPRPPAFSAELKCDGTTPDTLGFNCSGGDDMLIQAASGANGQPAVLVTVDGVPSAQAYPLPAGATLANTCCLDGCCQP